MTTDGTTPTAIEASPARTPRQPKARKGPVAPASRVLTAGLSIGAACAIITALAMSQPPAADTVQLDVTSSVDTAPTTTTVPAPPPTTIVVNKIYVPVPAGGDPGTAQTSSGTRRSSGGATSSGSGSASAAPSAGATSSPAPAAAAPAPTPTTAAPVATSKAS